MGKGQLHELIAAFMGIAGAMGRSCECSDMEKMAVLVHRVMSWRSRRFHTLEHVFGFLEGADASTALAAIFHDLIYVQVDGGLQPEVESLLGPRLERGGPGREGSPWRLAPARAAAAEAPGGGDSGYLACLAVFGLREGSVLDPASGLNEFLSALFMMEALRSHLPLVELVAAAACVEASIPFRGPDAEGRGVGEALEERLVDLGASGLVPVDRAAAVAMARRAVDFANKDIGDFALGDPGVFLSNTWKLLPETNLPLREQGTFSVREYRTALQRMRGFFGSLRPERVHHAYRGSPDPGRLAALLEATRANLECAKAYMDAKLLAVGLLEAVAELTGGDAPMALFMGDLPRGGEEREALSDHLPEVPDPPWLDPEDPVHRLLRDGRLDESSFDLKNSPIALFLFRRTEPGAWGRLVTSTEAFFAGRLGAREYLRGFEAGTLEAFIDACALMVPTRRDSLLVLRKRLGAGLD